MRIRVYFPILLMSILSFLALNGCNNKGGSKRIEVKTEKTEPQFIKEGILTFLNENDTIKSIDIEIADNNREKMQGMMYRSKMDYDKGMLFIFDFEEEQSFWMKNTKLSLDIMYVNSANEIVSIYKHTQPYSETPIPSLKPAIYVVETAAGFVDEFGIEVGNKIDFKRDFQPA